MTAALKLSPMARAAVRYAEHGWHVFPLQPRGKQPLLKGAGGFLSATADIAQVRAWWAQHPTANVGLWPGQSGLVVIDIDGPEGEVTAAKLSLLSEPTLECSTGRADGGRHLYFRRPSFSVSNCDLGHKLDVRGDAGYVVLPPSIHPTGTPYRWQGKVEDIRELPPGILARLEAVQSGAPNLADGAPNRQARDIAFDEEIGAGGRNNALTRYAGRLIAKGIPEDETLILVAAVNQTKCRPPLPQDELNALVANIATRESRKRVTTGGTTLALVEHAPPAPDEERQTPEAVAAEQVERARALLSRDVSQAPVWAWPELEAMTGPMLPGDFVVVGSLMGNGKSTLLMSQMDAFAEARMATLYIPLEVDPEVCRVRWAAWKLGLDVTPVIRQQWGLLPEGSREAVEMTLDDQRHSPFIHFAPPKRITLATLRDWCQWAKDEVGAKVIMLDHLHRMDFGTDAAAHRVTVTEVVRRLKDMARELELAVIAAAQLNRSTDPIDAFSSPLLGRLKESAGIAEEADVVLMLSRRLKQYLPDQWANKLRLGQLSERDLVEEGTMVVTCRKHRLDDSAFNRRILLSVRNGKIENRYDLPLRDDRGRYDP